MHSVTGRQYAGRAARRRSRECMTMQNAVHNRDKPGC